MDFLIHWPPGPVVATVQCQGLQLEDRLEHEHQTLPDISWVDSTEIGYVSMATTCLGFLQFQIYSHKFVIEIKLAKKFPTDKFYTIFTCLQYCELYDD